MAFPPAPPHCPTSRYFPSDGFQLGVPYVALRKNFPDKLGEGNNNEELDTGNHLVKQC